MSSAASMKSAPSRVSEASVSTSFERDCPCCGRRFRAPPKPQCDNCDERDLRDERVWDAAQWRVDGPFITADERSARWE